MGSIRIESNALTLAGAGHAISGDDTVGVLPGAGAGTFGPQVAQPTGASPRAVEIADLDADGQPDLSVANFDAGTVGVFIHTGGRTFAPMVTYAVDVNPSAVVAHDVNGKLEFDAAAPKLALVGPLTVTSVKSNATKGTILLWPVLFGRNGDTSEFNGIACLKMELL